MNRYIFSGSNSAVFSFNTFSNWGSTVRPDFTLNLVPGLAFGTPKFYIVLYDKIKHQLINLTSNRDVKSGLKVKNLPIRGKFFRLKVDPYLVLHLIFAGCFCYSRTSVAGTLMDRLAQLFRTGC